MHGFIIGDCTIERKCLLYLNGIYTGFFSPLFPLYIQFYSSFINLLALLHSFYLYFMVSYPPFPSSVIEKLYKEAVRCRSQILPGRSFPRKKIKSKGRSHFRNKKAAL